MSSTGSHIDAVEVFVDVLSQGEEGEAGEAFYGRLCEGVCRLTSMTRAVIFRYDGALRRVRAMGAYGIELAPFEGAHITAEDAPLAIRALTEDRVISVSGDFERQVPGPYAHLLQDGLLVCTPMVGAGRWVGVILSERPRAAVPLDERERHLLWTLGKTAALAAAARIATSQAEKAKHLTQRIDLAREIHERVVQRLFGVNLVLSSSTKGLSGEERERCAREVQGALADLRTAVQRPLARKSPPTRTTLAHELERLTEAHSDLRIVLEDGDPTDVPPELEPLAQSVLAEAIRNAHKHTTPTRVGVRIGSDDGTFVLEVTNDGARGRSTQSGMGLRLAAQEALQHGGIIEFGEREKGLWQVRLVVAGGAG